jgi:hypothetical protein
LSEALREKETQAKLHPELEPQKDPYLVDWDGPDDPENPRYDSFEALFMHWLIIISQELVACEKIFRSLFNISSDVFR